MMMKVWLSSVSPLPFFAAPGEGSGGAAADHPEAQTGGAAGGAEGDGAEGTAAVAAADGAEGAAGEGEDGEGGEQEGEEGARQGAGKPDWRDKELDRKHRRLKEAERLLAEEKAEKEAALALLERLQGKGGEGEAEGETPPVAKPAGKAQQPAPQKSEAQIRAEIQYDADCNATNAAGEKAYGADKWKDALKTLEKIGGFDQPTMQMILSTDNPAQVLYELGTRPEDAQELMELAPAKRFAKMVKMALPKPAAKKQVSNAPTPPETLRGSSSPPATRLRDDLTDDEWYRIRAAQKQKRFEARMAGRG